MTERTITFTSDGYRLEGTLTVPDGPGPHPAAILVVGSGPLDRDTNMKRQSLNVTRHLAEHLTAAGIATLRYDKRGVGASEGDYHATGLYENMADAAAAVRALQAEIETSATVVVGHSEGAMIATRLATQDLGLSGAVLLAGTARSGEAILRHQAVIASENLPALARGIMKLLRTDVHRLQDKRLRKLAASTEDSIRIQGIKINARWFREFMAHDPADDFPATVVPLLAITGKKDLQVPHEDLAVMVERAATPIETHAPDDLTHILRNDPDEPTLKAYRKLMGQPTDPATMDLVAAWIHTLVPHPSTCQPTSPG